MSVPVGKPAGRVDAEQAVEADARTGVLRGGRASERRGRNEAGEASPRAAEPEGGVGELGHQGAAAMDRRSGSGRATPER